MMIASNHPTYSAYPALNDSKNTTSRFNNACVSTMDVALLRHSIFRIFAPRGD